jgi:serine/threonine protein kinase
LSAHGLHTAKRCVAPGAFMSHSERIVAARRILLPGDSVGRYVLREPLGSGGQGEVWRADDSSPEGGQVALKLVDLASTTPSRLERLRREAEELAALRHPSLINCFGCFEDAKRELFAIVMELVQGRTLDAAVADPGLDARRRLLVLVHVASALEHVHRSGIVHRDVKLENVLLTEAFSRAPEDPASLKLIDFGIAVRSRNPSPLTRAGHIVGTPPYLAPEQLEPETWGGAAPSAACDVFSFGVMAWRLLRRDVAAHPVGLGPEADVDELALAYRRAAHDRWPPPFDDPKWNRFFRQALALRPADRLRDGGELMRALGGVPTLDDAPPEPARVRTIPGDPPPPMSPPLAPTRSERAPRRRPRSLGWIVIWCVLGGLLALALFVGYLLLQSQGDAPPPLPSAPSTR